MPARKRAREQARQAESSRRPVDLAAADVEPVGHIVQTEQAWADKARNDRPDWED